MAARRCWPSCCDGAAPGSSPQLIPSTSLVDVPLVASLTMRVELSSGARSPGALLLVPTGVDFCHKPPSAGRSTWHPVSSDSRTAYDVTINDNSWTKEAFELISGEVSKTF